MGTSRSKNKSIHKAHQKAKKVAIPTEISNINDTYVNPTNTGTKKPSIDNMISEDPNTYDRPPDTHINDNYENNTRDNESNPKSSLPKHGDFSVCSTGNRRHSGSHLVNDIFKSGVEKMIGHTVTEKSQTNTFHLLKSFYDKGLQNILVFSDDITAGNTSELMSQRFSMMYVVPGKDKGIDEDEAPLEAI